MVVRWLDWWGTQGMDVFGRWAPRGVVETASRGLFWPTLWWNEFLVRRSGGALRWYDEVWREKGARVLLGGYPEGVRGIETLRDSEGVRVCLNTVKGRPLGQAVAGVQEKLVGMTDFGHPTQAELSEGVAVLERAVQEGGTVYVHCKAGKGRSATVVLAWLAKHRGMSLDEAQLWLLTKRPQILQNLALRQVVRDVVCSKG